jgi:hypothetical protein
VWRPGLHIWVIQTLQLKLGINNAGELLLAMGHTAGLSIQDTVFDPGYFYVTTQEAQGAAWVLSKLGMNITDNVFFGLDNGIPAPLYNPVLWMSAAVIGGAAVMALYHNEFKLKLPTLEIATWAILGGILMGIGCARGHGLQHRRLLRHGDQWRPLGLAVRRRDDKRRLGRREVLQLVDRTQDGARDTTGVLICSTR